jgi:uncharacterized protein YkwD
MGRSLVRLGLGAGLVGAAGLLAPSGAVAGPACPDATLAPVPERTLTALINRSRAKAGLAPVAKAAPLVRAGRRKSLAMARGAPFQHTADLPWAGAAAAGQNLAYAADAQQAFLAMLRSPAHRRNLLDRAWHRAGVGAARDCSGMVYFTVNLIAPR